MRWGQRALLDLASLGQWVQRERPVRRGLARQVRRVRQELLALRDLARRGLLVPQESPVLRDAALLGRLVRRGLQALQGLV